MKWGPSRAQRGKGSLTEKRWGENENTPKPSHHQKRHGKGKRETTKGMQKKKGKTGRIGPVKGGGGGGGVQLRKVKQLSGKGYRWVGKQKGGGPTR